MATGLEIRAQIDQENVKGLLLTNGGAAVALLAALPQVFDKPGFESLASSILCGLLMFQFGLLAALVHNLFLRKCSLEWEQHGYRPPPCEWFGLRWMRAPCSCCVSKVLMVIALMAFLAGGIVVFLGGRKSLEDRAAMAKAKRGVKIEAPKTTPNTADRPTARRYRHSEFVLRFPAASRRNFRCPV